MGWRWVVYSAAMLERRMAAAMAVLPAAVMVLAKVASMVPYSVIGKVALMDGE